MAKKKGDEHACQARSGTEEQQNPNRVEGQAGEAKKMLAADKAAADKAEAAGDDKGEGE